MADLIVQDVPPRVLNKLVSDARRRNVSLNDAATGILAARYGIAREPSGSPFRAAPTQPMLLLNMPEELHRKLRVDAAARPGATMRGLVIAAIAAHYRVPIPAPTRRPRGTTTARQ